MKNYKSFIIRIEPFLPEFISGVLWTLDITGINEEEPYLKIFTAEDSSLNVARIEALLRNLAEQNLISDFEISEEIIEERNWNEDWEKTINVIEVSDKIVIKPTFRTYNAKEGQLVLTIDPKMSFGTGEHQTTKLMLQMVEKYVRPDFSVIDVGTGTGVLAIAAVKLGAKRAIAVDNDEWCYDNGIENCELNNVSGKVQILFGEVKDVSEKDFDLVIANINKNILMDIAEDLTGCLGKSGLLILSGLLDTDEDDIIKRYSALSLEVTDKKQMNEWISLVFRYK
ncbi:MAG: 50S ribosomal protein L11 methyltransferase [Ignavibacteria bacterium]